jgi:hypothetical protein
VHERAECELRLRDRQDVRLEFEPSMPSDRRSLEPFRLLSGDESDEVERVVERESAHLTRGDLRYEKVARLDRAGEPAMCCPLACHRAEGAGAPESRGSTGVASGHALRECGAEADEEAAGWRAYLTSDEPEEIATFCADCAERAFDTTSRDA